MARESVQLECPVGMGGSRRSLSQDVMAEPLVAAVPDGEHHHRWPDGGVYFGEWREGKPEGRGIYVWPSGDRYEGEWTAGREDGVGTHIAADGSTFYGSWVNGKMHGEGVYKPASPENRRAEVIFMREYRAGELIRETVLRVAEYDVRREEEKQRPQKDKRAEKKQAAKEQRLVKAGETIYRGHRSYDLMRNLQLGILFSIAKAGKVAHCQGREIIAEHFKAQVTQYFPRGATSAPFKWKDYCPAVFAHLREAFGLDNKDYLLSLTGDRALRELASPGKSGSVFFLSDDDRFLIKTVRKDEMRILLDLIPKYYRHCETNPDTLLTRFYGVHRVKPINGRKVRFVVMGNVFPTDVRLHRKYDLKGSTYGRTAGPKKLADPNAILKDLDIDFQLKMDLWQYDSMMQQIRDDCSLLEELQVMDYSLLLGVHFLSWGTNKWEPPSGIEDVQDKAATPKGHIHRGGPMHALGGKTLMNRQRDIKNLYQGELDGPLQLNSTGATTAPVPVPPAIPEGDVLHLSESAELATGRAEAAHEGSPLVAGEHHDSASSAEGRFVKGIQQIGGLAMQPVAGTGAHTAMHSRLGAAQHGPDELGEAAGALVNGPDEEGITLRALGAAVDVCQTQHHQQDAAVKREGMSAVEEALATASGERSDATSTSSETAAVCAMEAPASRQNLDFCSYSPPAQSQDAGSSRQSAAPASIPSSSSAGPCPDSMPRPQPDPDSLESRPGSLSASQNCPGSPLSTRTDSCVSTVGDLPHRVPSIKTHMAVYRTGPLSPFANANLPPFTPPAPSPAGACPKAVSFDPHPSMRQPRPVGDSPGMLMCPPNTPSLGRQTSEAASELGKVLLGQRRTTSSSPTRLSRLLHEAHSAERRSQSLDLSLLGPSPSQLPEGQAPLQRLHSVVRPQMGNSITALAIPRSGGPAQPVLLYFGIIDFLQEYSVRKKLEHFMKASLLDGRAISVVDPKTYSRRFQAFMHEVFLRKD
ncbi:hypothetical protein WJX72_006406 [[Myrmecia] bisecta]|uniref:1-phosphatidylinositol-4-phosphate 5-kinase n=1 Tax=[Myrmecia] bisecta TaxID=41462 RepID=A0AAW1Q0Y4_9CHLO